MKATKIIALPMAYCVFLAMLAQEAQAKDATEQFKGGVQYTADNVKDAADWTQDQVHAYLDKYQIAYNKNDENLLQTVQKYRDAAVANANYFINDKTNTVERLIEGLKIKLQKNYKLSENNVNAFTDDIQHELKQLELSGSLTHDKVKQSLDKLQHKAVKQKYVTAAQYQEIARDLESSFSTPTWFQRVFSTGPSHTGYFTDNSYQNWITSSVSKRLEQNKNLTKAEINSILDTLKNAIASTSTSVSDLPKLATAKWWKQLAADLEKNAQIKGDQAQEIVESLKDDVNAYKIFAVDYAGQAANQSQNYLFAALNYLKDTGNSLYQSVANPVKNKEAEAARAASSAASAAASATNAGASSANSIFASATDAAASNASVLRAQATQTVVNAKDSFGNFWRNKELETYRKIGYTEAHIDWIENYLSKTFQAKTNYAKDSVHNAIHTIREYLLSAKVQTASAVDSQLKTLEGLIESWKKTISRDEL